MCGFICLVLQCFFLPQDLTWQILNHSVTISEFSGFYHIEIKMPLIMYVIRKHWAIGQEVCSLLRIKDLI